jgi:hypothetical protein
MMCLSDRLFYGVFVTLSVAKLYGVKELEMI